MAQPTLSDVHVNVPLTNLSLMYAQEEAAFVARRVFPSIPVLKASDRYYVFSRADFNRNTMRKRAPSTESAGGGYKLDNTPNYSVDVWALHQDIDDQIRGNADAAVQLDMQATRWLVTQSLISRELDWATSFFAASLWTTDYAGVASGSGTGTGGAPGTSQVLQWNDNASQPIVDVRNLKRAVQLASGGFRPNKLVLGRPVFDVLCDHPDFIDRVKYGQTAGRPAQITLDAMAALFELDEVLVMDSIYNSGPDQAGPDSGGAAGAINAGELNAFIGGTGGKAAMLAYTPAAPGLLVPGCGYSFDWTGYFGAAQNGQRIKSFYIPQIASTRVEIESAYQHKIVGKDLGAFVTTLIA
jgi:hypothetical protein